MRFGAAAGLGAILVVSLVIAGRAALHAKRTAALVPVVITVTSAADSTTGVCPDATGCTLRAAITAANADVSGTPVAITFDAAVFPAVAPVTVTIASDALPPVTRDDVTIDASSAGVILSAYGQALASSAGGIVLAGARDSLRGLVIQGFPAACVLASGPAASIGGDASANQGNRIGSCATGIAVSGAAGTVSGNVIGFASDGSAATVEVGALVSAANVTVGDPGGCNACGNVIGNAPTGVRVGASSATSFGGVVIRHNTIGRAPAGAAAPVGAGVALSQPSGGTTVEANAIYAANTGIVVNADVNGVSVTGNRFIQNVFGGISGLAIDLNGDGVTNANGSAGHGGANGLLDHPVITRAIQSRISGVAGANCAGCSVQLYVAFHTPGGAHDYGTTPVPGGTTLTDGSGAFAFDSPAVSPGQWVTALVTDTAGNTSEFGPSARVGTGVAQCGNVTLTPGWNHVGFFGSAPAALGSKFPDSGAGTGGVTAIYHLDDGTGTFSHWFAGGGPGQTLATLDPGEAYWFLAKSTVNINTGFSLSVPLPVAVKAGWNDIVYIGASADVRDALGSLSGNFQGAFQWLNDPANPHWLAYGDASTPTWARGFVSLQTCATYEIYATSDGLLTPLQP